MKALVAIVLGFLIHPAIVGQVKPSAGASVKIINFEAFYDENSGIKEFIDLRKRSDREFAGDIKEIQSLRDKYSVLRTDTVKLSDEMNRPSSIEWKEGVIEAKLDELKKMECTIRSKQDQVKDLYEKRQDELTKPLVAQIKAALARFQGENGISVIFDRTKFEEGSYPLSSAELKQFDVTKQFIDFFNNDYSKKRVHNSLTPTLTNGTKIDPRR